MIGGIDLGTTNSLVAVWRDGKVEIIPNSLGQNLTPSVVGVDEEGKFLVGLAARAPDYAPGVHLRNLRIWRGAGIFAVAFIIGLMGYWPPLIAYVLYTVAKSIGLVVNRPYK